MRNTLTVYERLKREQHINTLFRQGKAYSVFPLRFIYLLQPRPALADVKLKGKRHSSAATQVGFSVPKKKFKLSVHRHKVRRLLFEAWRVQKNTLLPFIPNQQQLHVFVLCTSATMPSQEQVNAAMQAGIERLGKSISSQPPLTPPE